MKIPTIATVKIIMSISDKVNYGGAVTRKSGITSGKVVNTLKDLEKNKFITQERKGRQKFITILEKGERLRYLLNEIQLL